MARESSWPYSILSLWAAPLGSTRTAGTRRRPLCLETSRKLGTSPCSCSVSCSKPRRLPFPSLDTARALFPAAFCFRAVNRNASERMERFPGDALRILDPVFVRPGIAARRPGLVERSDTGFRHLLAQILQFVVGFHLKSQVVDPGRAAPSRNGKVDPRILEHPLGVVVLHDGRRRAEEVAVETQALGQILDGNVNMESLHVTFSFRLRATGLYAGAQVPPPQQFSVK